MDKAREIELLGNIEILERRIEVLELQNSILSEGLSRPTVQIAKQPTSKNAFTYLLNFIGAALFPLVAGAFRSIYRRIYGFKK